MIEIGSSVRIAGGTGLPRHFVLPQIPNAQDERLSPVEWFGQMLSNSLPLFAGSSAAGAILGMRLGRNGSIGRVGGGLLGAVGGTAIAAGVAASLHRFRGEDEVTGSGGVAPLPTETVTREGIRVLTFNIHGGQGGPGERKPSTRTLDAIAETIRREHPDVVLLQEVDDTTARSLFRDEFNELARRLSPDGAAWADPTRQITGRGQGVAVMTFNGFTVDNARDIHAPDPWGDGFLRRTAGTIGSVWNALDRKLTFVDLPDLTGPWSGFMPRNAIDTVVRTPAGNTVRVLSTHLSGFTDRPAPSTSQAVQLPPITSAINAWSGPTILGGDFNVRASSQYGKYERAELERVGMHDAFSEVGIAPNDQRRDSMVPKEALSGGTARTAAIDHIYASSQLRAKKAYVVDMDPRVSDHRPVVTDFVLEPGSTT